MAKSAPPKDIELHPDARERFERAAEVVAKSPAQHRVAKKKKAALRKRRAPKLGKKA